MIKTIVSILYVARSILYYIWIISPPNQSLPTKMAASSLNGVNVLLYRSMDVSS